MGFGSERIRVADETISMCDSTVCELCEDEDEMLVLHQGMILCWQCIEALEEEVPMSDEQIEGMLAYVRQRNQ